MRVSLGVCCLVLACHSSASGTGPSASASASAKPPSATHTEGLPYTVGLTMPTCAPGAECSFQATVTALGNYHVNPEYPYRLTMDGAMGVTFLGKDAQAPSTFSKAAGDFALAGEKVGVMTVRYRAAAGTHPVTGTLKLSVCTTSTCLMEQAKVMATLGAH